MSKRDFAHFYQPLTVADNDSVTAACCCVTVSLLSAVSLPQCCAAVTAALIDTAAAAGQCSVVTAVISSIDANFLKSEINQIINYNLFNPINQ